VRTALDRAWEESAKNNPKLEGIVTDEYLEIRGPDGMSQVFWTAFSGYGEASQILVLIRDTTGYPFSARFFQSEADWQEFRKFIASKLNTTHKLDRNFFRTPTILLAGWIIVSIIMVVLVLRAGAK
jgi:hypothetical protein